MMGGKKDGEIQQFKQNESTHKLASKTHCRLH